MKRNTQENSGCGCCGREANDVGFWCDDCSAHVAHDRRPPWDRTYEAITGKPCPFDLVNLIAAQNQAARASAESVQTALPNTDGLPNRGELANSDNPTMDRLKDK